MYYVYILQDSEQKLYVGYSHDLKQRIQDHSYKKVFTTRTYEEPRLVWYCAFIEKKAALEFEKYLKAGSGHAFARKHFVGEFT